MSSLVLSELLSEVGWDSRFAIPVANAENKALLDEIQRKQKEKANIDNRVSQHKERIGAMSEHLRNVQQELSHTQALCKAREKEAESELHLRALAEREAGRLRQEISQLEKELGSLRENQNHKENNIFKATQKLERHKDQLNWDQRTLDAWLEESTRKDEDTMAIARYARQDESKIRELTLSIEKLTQEANQKRKALDNELTETVTAQIALDKTVETFRQAHVERQELIGQWENTIQQMRKRDQDLQRSALSLAETKQAIRERQTLVNEKRSFLTSEAQNNEECERKISAAERRANRLQQQLQDEEGNRARLLDELESLKSAVDRTATDVEAMRSHLTSTKKETSAKTTKLQEARLYNAALEEKLRAATEEALSVEERAAQMEQLLRQQEQRMKETDTQLHRQRELLFRKSQDLQSLRAKEKNIAVEITGSRAALFSLDNRLGKLEQSTLKQHEVIYHQDFQIQRLETKVAHLSGNLNREEKRELENRTAELIKALEEKKKTSSMLSSQLKKLQHDIRCVKKDNERAGADSRDLTSKIEELNLHNDTLDKELKRLHLGKQDGMVEDNILRLEVRRLRDLLYNRADGVLSLEKRKLQLQAAMRGRQEEIRAHREMLTKQLRINEQERQGLSADLHERLSEIDKTRKRYEIMTVVMAAPEGEEDKSQAFYIIKAAQEKEELQREGDRLDADIRKKEKELRALENTLQVLNNCNSTYRKSLNKVTQSSPECQEKLKLEEQKRAADEKFKFKRRQVRELQQDVEGMSRSVDNLLQEEATQRARRDDIQSRIESLNKELGSQREKTDRAAKQCSRLSREIRLAKKTKEKTFEERDIELKELRDRNKSVDKALLELMDELPELRDLLHEYFTQAGVGLPSPASTPSSRQSSRLGSGRSSTSLRSSRSSGSSAGGSSRGSTLRSPTVKTVELGLDLSTPPPNSSSPRASPLGAAGGTGSSRVHNK